MRRLAVAVAAAAVALAGCGGSGQLLRREAPRPQPTTTARTVRSPSPASVYLAQLGTEQTKLANAEQAIPTSPRTPAALAHSVDLLAAAVRRLADGLSAIKPPARVAAPHARLSTIMRSYAAELDQAARIAVAPGGEQRAGALLISATDRASRTFTTTIQAIDSTLGNTP